MQASSEIRELQHRFSNNLQIIVALLRAHARKSGHGDASEAFNAAAERIAAFDEINSCLEASRSGAVSPRVLLTRLARGLRSAAIGPRPIELKVDACEILVGSRIGTALGLIANELVTNAIKYAFPGERPGMIHVSCQPDGIMLRLSVEDNGIGMPQQLVPGLGLQLVHSLALQNSGTVHRRFAKGARMEVYLPLARPERAAQTPAAM
jgi:two-component sensor histidine kinase